MGLLEGYFVALYAYNQEPKTYEEKLENCKYAFKLIDDANVHTPNCTPEGKNYKIIIIKPKR
jgi:hypothetical protein